MLQSGDSYLNLAFILLHVLILSVQFLASEDGSMLRESIERKLADLTLTLFHCVILEHPSVYLKSSSELKHFKVFYQF